MRHNTKDFFTCSANEIMIWTTNIKIGLIILIFLIGQTVSQTDRVLLRDITSLTLRRGDYTAGRRSAPIPKLECVGGTAYGNYAPKVVQCYNRGFDGVDVQWECKAEMDSAYEFGKIDVSCEGYDYPNDPFVLAGSCGLKYELDYTASGARTHAFSPSAPKAGGIDMINIVYFVIACFVIYLIYTTLTAPREGNEGDRNRRGGGGFDQGPGYPPGGGGPPPPGWRQDPPPPYDDSCKGGTSGAGCGTAGGARSGGTSTGGPGFFTGLGLGALGGYLFGGNNSGYGGARRRNYFSRGGYNQFDQDTGFYDGPSTSSSYNRPSTSSYSGGTHSSSGFGSTSRR